MVRNTLIQQIVESVLKGLIGVMWCWMYVIVMNKLMIFDNNKLFQTEPMHCSAKNVFLKKCKTVFQSRN